MTAETHSQLANFIWSICNLLRGPYKRNEYRNVILPVTVLRRFDCLLAPTKAAVLEEYPVIKKKPETVVRSLLQKITKRPFYNLSKLDFKKLLDDPNQLAPNLNSYINKFSPNVRDIIDRFGFDEHIARMAEKNLASVLGRIGQWTAPGERPPDLLSSAPAGDGCDRRQHLEKLIDVHPGRFPRLSPRQSRGDFRLGYCLRCARAFQRTAHRKANRSE